MFFNAFRITPVLHVGTFPEIAGQVVLRRHGITHILNLGPRGEHAPEGFVWEAVPIEDLQRMPDGVALRAIDALHSMVTTPGSRVFVHCLAGQNRSPTVSWLYLLACGIPRADATDWIADASFDAVPGHPRLIDRALVKTVVAHGRQHGFTDRSRTEAFEPWSGEHLME